MVSAAQEGLESVETEQAYVHEEIEERQLADIGRMVVIAALKARRIRALLSPVLTIPVALCTAFIFWRGTSLVLQHKMELGALSGFQRLSDKVFRTGAGPLRDNPTPSLKRRWRFSGYERSLTPTR